MTDDQINQLERLAKLRAAGTLDAAEYENAKAAVLSPRDPAGANNATSADAPSAAAQPPLSPTWQMRFAFFDQHGRPGSPSASAAQSQLSLGERVRITSSTLGFFLGPIYFLVLGLWRPAIVMTAGWLALSLAASGLGVSDGLVRALGFGVAGVFATITVPLYYEKIRHGEHRWNPFFFFGHAQER